MKPSTKAYVWTIVTVFVITITTWLAGDPPSPWAFVIGAAGLLVCVGIIRVRSRAGHFDK